MTKACRWLVVIALAALSLSCHRDEIYGSGLWVEEPYHVIGGYKSVRVRDGLRLVVDPTLSSQMVVVRSDEELVGSVSVKVFRDELSVGYKNPFTFQTQLVTEVHIPDDAAIVEYSLRDSEMVSTRRLERDSLDIVCDHSKVTLAMNADYVNLKAEDGSQVMLEGEVGMCSLNLDGSMVDAGMLFCDSVLLQMSASRLNIYSRNWVYGALINGSELRLDGMGVAKVDLSHDSTMKRTR